MRRELAAAAAAGLVVSAAELGQVSDRVGTLESSLGSLTAATSDLLQLVDADVSSQRVTIRGANLHLENGDQLTDSDPNGLGNLVVGYAENTTISGSHNVVIGTDHHVHGHSGLAVGAAADVGDKEVGIVADTVLVEASVTQVKGTSTLDLVGETLVAEGNAELRVEGGDVTVTASDDVSVTGVNVTAAASAAIDLSGAAGAELSSGATVSVNGSLITLN